MNVFVFIARCSGFPPFVSFFVIFFSASSATCASTEHSSWKQIFPGRSVVTPFVRRIACVHANCDWRYVTFVLVGDLLTPGRPSVVNSLGAARSPLGIQAGGWYAVQ